MLTGRKPIGTIGFMGGVPAVLTDFCRAWGRLVQYSLLNVCEANETIYLDDADYSDHGPARNALAQRFLGDWLLMLDTDHAPEPDILGRLLHRMYEHKLDVIVGVYQFRKRPHAPVLYGWVTPDQLAPLGKWKDDVPVQTVGAAGAGCLLVRRTVYDRIRTELKEEPFDRVGARSEDLSFFTRLKKLGIKSYFDIRVECPHLVVKPVSLKDWDRPGKAELMPPIDVQGFSG